MTADITGLPVIAGPAEATVMGNVIVQALAQGRFPSLAEARDHLSHSLDLKKFMPRQTPAIQETGRRYAAIEARWFEDKASDVIHYASH